MFTGLIREIGTLKATRPGPRLTQLDIDAPRTAPDLGIGDSLAVDGICLTVTAVRGSAVTVEAAAETIRVTTVRRWRTGRRVHLEPSLRVGQAIDGHLVQGHVDGIGTIIGVRRAGASTFMTVGCSPDLARYLMPKGSVAVDGVSLTVDAGPHTDRFTVNLIPHSLKWTTFAGARRGRGVNLEMDVLVKAARSGRTAEAFAGLGEARPAADGRHGLTLDHVLSRGFRRGKERS